MCNHAEKQTETTYTINGEKVTVKRSKCTKCHKQIRKEVEYAA